jgi:hypothetical protein
LTAAGTALAVSYDGEDRGFQVFNYSGSDIVGIYATDRDRTRWGPDLLGNSIVPSGYQTNWMVRPALDRGYCLFDIGVQFADGSTDTIWNVNLCTARGLAFGNNGHRVLR